VEFAEPRFELSHEELSGSKHVITVAGEIHVSTAPRFSEQLNAAILDEAPCIVLDLSDVDFIDSTGLSVLLNGLRRVTRQRGRMVLVATNPTVLRLFEITRLNTTFDIRQTRDEAVAALSD
jgi:anti-sigma B factor antagonist